jgi:hypothetical protein
LDARLDQTVHELIGHQSSSFHDVVNFEPDGVLLLNMPAQHFAGGNMGPIDALLAQ